MDRSLEWLVTVFIAHAIFESLFELILFLLHFHEKQDICKDLDCFIVCTPSICYRYTKFGGPAPHRPVEDLAFAVARFIQKGGSFINYYLVSGPIFLLMNAVTLINSIANFYLLKLRLVTTLAEKKKKKKKK